MSEKISRRSLLGAAPVAFSVLKPQQVRGVGKEKVKAGLVGCGGRGTAAIVEMAAANDNVELIAMADAFEDKLEGSLRSLRDAKLPRIKRYVGQTITKDGKPHKLTEPEIVEKLKKTIKVAPDHHFVGQDAFKRLLATDVDVVLLITPPGHRPLHFEAAVEAKKHVFIEKPIGTDPVGVRRVMAAARRADALGLTIVAGTETRYTARRIETIEKIHAGAIGDIVSLSSYWLGTPVFHVQERKPGWSEVDWQHRNWYSFVWICGDQLVEQHVHRIDLLNWAMQAHPVKAIGSGGRAWRRDDNPLHGNIYDHMSVEFTYPNGVKMASLIRHYPRMDHMGMQHGVDIIGTKGRSDGEDLATSGSDRGGGLEEQALLVNSVRGDIPRINNAMAVAESTLTCVMGREAAYSGQTITWDQVMKSELDLYPKDLSPGADIPIRPPAVPGEYRFA
ncbi:MAG: Gfo/Idh/MocA family oxidoreductase [bacterium]|nr:Gfo/Idh/MocA family oxidoreductase [bacterium]